MILIYKFNVDYKNNTKKIFIEALEQRIMLDGAGASTFLDIIDDRNQDKFLQKNSKKITNFSENKIDDQSQKLPFDQVTRDQKRNERKQVVFIDSQVQDYQTLINAFNEDTEVHLIQSNEDGFKKIDSVLKDNCDVSSLHIIGHGSAGKILFGNATLSNDTIQLYNQTLRSIGQCLTEDGDILFYGCNVASTEGGKTLINKISEITKADIAASDDVTGKSGDWKLESKVGNIETKNISQTDYQHDLTMYRTASAATTAAEVTVGADGITSIKGAMAAFTGTADRNAFDFKSSRDHNPGNSGLYQDYYLTYNSGTFGTGNNSHSDKVHRFTVVLEQTGITSGSFEARRPDHPGSYNGGGATTNNLTESQWEHSMHNIDINTTDSADYKLSATAPNSTTGPLDVYMVALDSHFGSNSDRYNKIAEVVFDREIVGILIDSDQTVKASSNTGNVDLHNSNNSTYPDPLDNSNRGFETIQWRYFRNNYNNGQWGYGTYKDGDWFAVGGTDNRTLHVAAKNTGGGDYARILVKGEVANNAPVARNDVGVISEDGTLTVDNSDNANVSGSYDATGEHSGDVLQTSSTSHYDTDADSDTLVVASVRTGGTEGSGSAGTLGSALTGTYGQLTLNANGSYTYVANQSAADDLDAGDSVTDVFNYTVSDGNGGTDTATITITVLGTNDAPVAQNDVGYIQEGKTLTVTNGANANVSGSYDATGEHSGDVINTSSGSHSDSDADDSASLVVSAIRTGGSEGSGTAGTLGQSLSGTYGALTMNANGSYTYVSTANSVSGTVTDVFNYTLSDGTATDIATLTITIYNSNDPVARNDVAVISEDGTLSVSDGDNANVSGSYDATGEHSGDILQTSSTSHYDTDADSDTLTVDSFRTGGSEGSGSAGTLGSALTGTYGQLTLNANGSYSYVANQSAADDLDDGDSVTDVFNYTVSDGNGGTDTATITITILGINDTPVAVDDTDSVNANETTTAIDGSSNDVLTDDTDADDSASLTVTAIQPSGGSSSNVSSGSSYNSSGTEVTGTYGTLTIGADGSYTYVADQDAADNIGSGSSETDVFTYTVSDGTDTTTATLTITVSGTEDTTTTAIKETKKEKKEAKKQKKELKKERKELKKAKRLLLKEFKLAKSSINRSAEFNQGLKLVDLVAESGSIDFKQGEEDISKLNAKFTDKSLKVKFKVFNDEGKDVQKYYGTMKDGSPLPKWIQVDPKTGKTKTEIPKGVKMVEFKIIAIDVDNNKKQVTVIIDATKLAKDKDVLKQTRKLLKEKTIEVKNDGTVKLNSIDKDGSIDKTITNTINDSQSIEDIIKTIEPDEFLNLQSELSDNEQVVDLSVSLDFLIQNEFKTSFEDIKIVLKDGQELPNWIKFDPNSGKIISNPPKDVSSVDLKIIVEDPNGEIIVKDLTINFSKENLSNFQKNLDNDTRFVSLSSQLSKEYSNWDNYGSQLIDRL